MERTAAPLGSRTVRVICQRLLQPTGIFRRRSLSPVVGRRLADYMANRFQIPRDVETRLRRSFKVCAYCGRRMKPRAGINGDRRATPTIEHLNRAGPFYWSDGLQEEHLVIVCAQCNSSRGTKRLADWFASPYCLAKRITARTVASQVREYLRTAVASR